MFKHILVPLDGSALAESALPAAVFLAEKLGARVTLAHIIERDAIATVHGEHHLTRPEEAEAYLRDAVRRFFPPAMTVECHVHTAATERIARGIVEHQHELAPDLVIMCTHGHGGLRDMIFGSIAQQVVAAGRTPVLLIRPPLDTAGFVCRRLLVPLDGDQEHEKGLWVARDLAKATGATLDLLCVVPTADTLAGKDAKAGRLMPRTTRAALEMAAEDAVAHLAGLSKLLRQEGLTIQAVVRRGSPVAEIMAADQREGASLIVLGTHGKAGADAFWAGSIAHQILMHTRRPLLLVPVESL